MQDGGLLDIIQFCDLNKTINLGRALEFTIFDHELADIRRKLDLNIQKQLRELERQWSGFEEERLQMISEQSERFKEKTKLELAIRDLKEEVEGERSNRRKAENELDRLKAEITEKQASLDQVQPRFNELIKQEQQVNTELAIAEQRQRELYSKQGWTEQFRSAEERDQWIKRNLAKITRQISDKRDQESTQELEQQRESIERNKRHQNELKHNRDALQNERQELWRTESGLSQSLQACKEEINHMDMILRSIVPKAIIHGMDSVKKVIESLRSRHAHSNLVDGYYGMLIENFQTDKRFYTAVEMTAGNKLFYHIVENDRIGTKILEEINRQRLPGEVNFFPLNRIQYRPHEYPQNQYVLPMINQLQFEERFLPVMQHCFGKTLICRNMDVATQMARSERMDCITLEGDRVSSRGALTGGFCDVRRSRLQLQSQRWNLKQQAEELETQLHSQREQLTVIEGKINGVSSEMQKLETKTGKMIDVYEKLQQDGRLLREERQMLQQSKHPKERQLSSLESTLQQLEAQKESLNRDLGSEMLSQLTVDEQSSLEELNRRILKLKESAKVLFNERSELETEKNRLENQLQKNLLRKKEELQLRLQEISMADRTQSLDSHQSELLIVTQRITEISRRMGELEHQLEEYYIGKKKLNQQLEMCQNQERDVQAKITEDAKEMEKMANKQSMLLRKKEDTMKKIRELGSLPSDAFDKYHNLSSKQLFKQLEQCNNELKKYENVNKKALDQFVSFSEQKEKLLKRKDEVDGNLESIMDMISQLDQKKYDAIQLTFKLVSKYFEEVFHELVPTGRGHLVMKTMEMNGDNAVDLANIPQVEQFTGVGIKVAFSGADETKEMQQLSGGQKSLVALALIFAIQKCDPAPFYLFDEIDAALDARHRKSVAVKVKKTRMVVQKAVVLSMAFCPTVLSVLVEIEMKEELFYRIADNDGIVTTVMEEVNCQRLPDKVNCFPLNRILKSKNDVMKKLHGWGSLLWVTIVFIRFCIFYFFFILFLCLFYLFKQLEQCNNELKKYENVKTEKHLVKPKGEKLLMRKVKSMEIDEVHQVSKCIEEFFRKLTAVDRGHFRNATEQPTEITVKLESEQKMDSCSLCGCSEFSVVDGYYFCDSCGAQSQHSEQQMDHEYEYEGEDGSMFMDVSSSDSKSKVEYHIKFTPEQLMFNAYTKVMQLQADALIACGFPKSVKTAICILWFEYVKDALLVKRASSVLLDVERVEDISVDDNDFEGGQFSLLQWLLHNELKTAILQGQPVEEVLGLRWSDASRKVTNILEKLRRPSAVQRTEKFFNPLLCPIFRDVSSTADELLISLPPVCFLMKTLPLYLAESVSKSSTPLDGGNVVLFGIDFSKKKTTFSSATWTTRSDFPFWNEAYCRYPQITTTYRDSSAFAFNQMCFRLFSSTFYRLLSFCSRYINERDKVLFRAVQMIEKCIFGDMKHISTRWQLQYFDN
ncbi:Structural maintenance of chromosomes protein 3 [Trichinella sp. T8]|nr:Structural maintenance of chromosomes protein 3 [Trichinella sp. T8]